MWKEEKRMILGLEGRVFGRGDGKISVGKVVRIFSGLFKSLELVLLVMES